MDAKLALEMAVAGELTKLRLVERALHDSSAAWGVAVGDLVFPAHVEVTETGVEFVAEVYAPVCGPMSLWVDQRPASRQGDEITAEVGEELTWTLTLGSLAVA